MTKVVTGDKRTVIEYAPASGVAANLEAFADAAEGRAPYSITQDEMIWNIAALEAVIASAASGHRVHVT
jgi:predicted dehydrogenase